MQILLWNGTYFKTKTEKNTLYFWKKHFRNIFSTVFSELTMLLKTCSGKQKYRFTLKNPDWKDFCSGQSSPLRSKGWWCRPIYRELFRLQRKTPEDTGTGSEEIQRISLLSVFSFHSLLFFISQLLLNGFDYLFIINAQYPGLQPWDTHARLAYKS